jgi:hypothetical protein
MSRRRWERTLGLLALAGLAQLLAGCAQESGSGRVFAVDAGRYPEAFDATRDALRSLDFELDRVDAATGVITTLPHFSPGLLEPWDHTQTGLGSDWEDTVNMQAREVRVTFSPAEPRAPSAGGDAPLPDLRLAEGNLVGSVWVTLHRQHRAGRRLDSEWVGGSTFYMDPDLGARAGSRYLVPIKRDEALEARLAEAIREKLGSAGSAAVGVEGDDHQSP